MTRIPIKTTGWSVVVALSAAACACARGEEKPAKADNEPVNVERILEQEADVPDHVTYKKASREVNRKAIEKLAKSLLAAQGDELPADLFVSPLFCGPGLWTQLKDDADLKAIQEGCVAIRVPTGKGVTVLEAKLFQKDEQTAAFWKVLRRKHSFDHARIRRPNSEELAAYWAMISFDITEPIFMIETKDALMLAHLTGEDPGIVWIDDLTHLRSRQPAAAEVNQLRLYVPIPELEERFGKDAVPLATYVKTLAKRAEEILAEQKPPEAKGLLIAVGIKSKQKTRIWCEAVDGEAPQELLRRLETELAKVEAVDLLKGPAGLALEMNLFGAKPAKYPEFPQSWVDAAKKTDSKLLIPPDELFKTIWPD